MEEVIERLFLEAKFWLEQDKWKWTGDSTLTENEIADLRHDVTVGVQDIASQGGLLEFMTVSVRHDTPRSITVTVGSLAPPNPETIMPKRTLSMLEIEPTYLNEVKDFLLDRRFSLAIPEDEFDILVSTYRARETAAVAGAAIMWSRIKRITG